MIGAADKFSTPTTVLGDTFVRNYYIYHDMDNKRIGMYGDYMVYHESEDNYLWLIGLGIGVVIVIAAIIGVIFYLRYKRRRPAENQNNGQNDRYSDNTSAINTRQNNYKI